VSFLAALVLSKEEGVVATADLSEQGLPQRERLRDAETELTASVKTAGAHAHIMAAWRSGYVDFGWRINVS
jgi:hypothetical protein